ncbi:ATP-binding protein [Kitasatospora sp. NPDC090091]|uniref:ATP-binding protein n=1 Tax=Kitasatospora sp. NPDC090091 TaxID=3364081 RepID=UPI0037FE5A45
MILLSDIASRSAPPQRNQDVAVRAVAAPATICLPYRPESVAAARRFVGAKLREWGLDDLMDDASVIVSELATNSVRTGCQTRMLVAVRRPSDRVIRILVGDGSRSMPVMVETGPGHTSGRGLAMVHRLTRGRWGVTPLPLGKIVHADLTVPEPTSR